MLLDTLDRKRQAKSAGSLLLKTSSNILIIGTCLWLSINRFLEGQDLISCLMLVTTLLMILFAPKNYDTTSHEMATTRLEFSIPAGIFVCVLTFAGLIYDTLT